MAQGRRGNLLMSIALTSPNVYIVVMNYQRRTGMYPRKHQLPDINDRYGRWTVVGVAVKAPNERFYRIPCRCECGTETLVLFSILYSGHGQSCGCLARERVTKHGGGRGRLYRTWIGIRKRCLNENDARYPDYGARGITVSDAWVSDFKAFRDWSLANGYADGLQIDRIDGSGPYSPNNCRWTTSQGNNRNRRNNHRITAFGETKSAVEWTEDARCTIGCTSLLWRLKNGWPPERAITQQSRYQRPA